MSIGFHFLACYLYFPFSNFLVLILFLSLFKEIFKKNINQVHLIEINVSCRYALIGSFLVVLLHICCIVKKNQNNGMILVLKLT